MTHSPHKLIWGTSLDRVCRGLLKRQRERQREIRIRMVGKGCCPSSCDASHQCIHPVSLHHPVYSTDLISHCLTLCVWQVSTREEISDLLSLEGHIDLVIPRGSTELVRAIQDQSHHIPVMGHAEGICHVYVDSDADLAKALKIGKW